MHPVRVQSLCITKLRPYYILLIYCIPRFLLGLHPPPLLPALRALAGPSVASPPTPSQPTRRPPSAFPPRSHAPRPYPPGVAVSFSHCAALAPLGCPLQAPHSALRPKRPCLDRNVLLANVPPALRPSSLTPCLGLLASVLRPLWLRACSPATHLTHDSTRSVPYSKSFPYEIDCQRTLYIYITFASRDVLSCCSFSIQIYFNITIKAPNT